MVPFQSSDKISFITLILFFDYQLNVSHKTHQYCSLNLIVIVTFLQQSKIQFKMTSLVPILIRPPLINSNLIMNTELKFRQIKSLTHSTLSRDITKNMETNFDYYNVDQLLHEYSKSDCKLVYLLFSFF